MAASSGSDQLVLFNQYDSEYCSKATDVARKIEAVAALSGDQRRAKARELDADLKEADQIVRPWSAAWPAEQAPRNAREAGLPCRGGGRQRLSVGVL